MKTLYVLYNKETKKFGLVNERTMLVYGAARITGWQDKSAAIKICQDYADLGMDFNGFSLYEYNGQLGKKVI